MKLQAVNAFTNYEDCFIDEHGVKQGPFKIYFKPGHVKISGTYVNGLKHGTIINYKEKPANGSTRSEINFINGQASGLVKQFHNNYLILVTFVRPSSNGPELYGEYRRINKKGEFIEHKLIIDGKHIDIRKRDIELYRRQSSDLPLL